MTAKQQAFKIDIEHIMKKLTDRAEETEMYIVISVSIKPKDDNKGFNHMKAVYANSMCSINHALAVADEMPTRLKKQMLVPMLGILTGDENMETDQEGDNRKEFLPPAPSLN